MAAETEVITPGTPVETGPTPEELEEKKFRERLKEKYGIEDDPEEFKKKRSVEQEAFQTLPRYHQALTFAHQMLTGSVKRDDPPLRSRSDEEAEEAEENEEAEEDEEDEECSDCDRRE